MQRSWGEGHAALRLQARPGLYTSCLSPDRLTAGSQAWVRARMPRGWNCFFCEIWQGGAAGAGQGADCVLWLCLLAVLICSAQVRVRGITIKLPKLSVQCHRASGRVIRCRKMEFWPNLSFCWWSMRVLSSGHPGELCTSTAAPAADASNR